MRIRTATAFAAVVLTVLATAAAPAAALPRASASWARYVVAPANRHVRPVRVLATTGTVDNPAGTLGRGVTTLTRAAPLPRPGWAAGTTAAASSFHDGNNGNDGRPRTYLPGNAIDGDTDTFWNDDTLGAYPDVLTITTPSPVDLPGVTVLSNADGVLADFTVDTWDGSAWQSAAAVTGNAAVQLRVPFAAPAHTDRVRITVTADQSSGKGDFT